MRYFFLILLMTLTSVLSAGVFQWKDANGNTVFGDSPPISAAAAEVDLPMLTVADRYSREDKAEEQPVTASAENVEDEQPSTVEYERFSINSPGKGATIRSNNGNLMVKLDLKPALQEGHGVALYMDGKQVANGAATTFALTEVDRGEHRIFAVLHNKSKHVLKNTEAMKFTVLRVSKRN